MIWVSFGKRGNLTAISFINVFLRFTMLVLNLFVPPVGFHIIDTRGIANEISANSPVVKPFMTDGTPAIFILG